MDIKKLLTQRGVSFYLAVASFVLALVVLILYLSTGVTEFTPKLDGATVALLIVGLIINAATAVFEVKMAKYVAYIIYLFAFCTYIRSEISYIANVFVSIDGTQFSASFLCTAIFMLAAIVVSLVSACFIRDNFVKEVKEAE